MGGSEVDANTVLEDEDGRAGVESSTKRPARRRQVSPTARSEEAVIEPDPVKPLERLEVVRAAVGISPVGAMAEGWEK